MKGLFLFIAVFLVGTVVKCEEIFFPSKIGTVLVYKTFDKKDKETSMVKYTITKLNINGKDMDITYLCESFNQKEEPAFKEELTIHKKGDKIYLDMSNFINKAALQKNGEMPAEIKISGNNMEIPVNPNPGDMLPDARIEMAMNIGFISMKMSADVTNRKVEALEDITVKGGTFKCYKFSSVVNSSAMGIKTKSSNIDWYAKGIGIVRTESYDKNGKLQSYTELIEVKQ